MECQCCRRAVTLTRFVQLREVDMEVPPGGFTSPEDPRYLVYAERTQYRPGFVCPACYAELDGEDGVATIDGRMFGIASRSRGGRATTYTEERYRRYQARAARRLGIELA